MDINLDEADPEFDPTTEQGREDINDNETEADIDRNQRSQEQAQRDYEERMDDVRIRGMRETVPTELIEMIDDVSRLNNRDVREISPTIREKSRYLEWFNRARTYLREKGAKFKDNMALAFFRRQEGYGRIPGEAAGEVSGVIVGDVDGEGNDGFETEEQLQQARDEVLEREERDERMESMERRREGMKKALVIIKRRFPNAPIDVLKDFSIDTNDAGEIVELFSKMPEGKLPFTFDISENGTRVMFKLNRGGGKWHDIDSKDLPKTITKFLGDKVEDIVSKKEDIVVVKEKEKARLEKVALDDNESAETRAEAVRKAMKLDDEIDRLNWEIEKLERENMSVRERVRRIFKKNGFTIAAIVSSVGIIIGAVVSNLKAGLGKIAKGMGNGLKSLGKKLGQVLPGIAGAIASFIFKTAGEVIGFLGKNAWLLIVAVVLYAVDQIKGKR